VLDTVFGVPAHPLIVHATVVLLPLAALCAIAVALVPALRRRFGLLVGLLTVAAVALVPVTTASGDKLFARQSARFGPDDAAEAGLMEQHRELAGNLLPAALLLLLGVVLVLLPLLARRRAAEPVAHPVGAGAPAGAPAAPAPAATAGWTRPVAVVGALVTLAGAVLTLVLVVRIGHLGSEAAWARLDQPARSMSR
jgi:uncharacterized membrane protein